MPLNKTQIDHLVVVAQNLEQGVQWCESTIGITPGPGGEHAQHGTHNRLFKIATPANPYAYFEIIAINPSAKLTGLGKRWFDMDDPAVVASVAVEPRLLHFVVNTEDIRSCRMALQSQDMDCGPVTHANRQTRKGMLKWQITVREDGQRLFNGVVPSLIQWGSNDDPEPMRLHPRNSLPRSGVSLKSISISHPSADKVQRAYEAIGLMGVSVEAGPANLTVELNSPNGTVTLQSLGL